MNADHLRWNTTTLVRFCGCVALYASLLSFVSKNKTKNDIQHTPIALEWEKKRSYRSAYKEIGDTKLPEKDRKERKRENWKSKRSIDSVDSNYRFEFHESKRIEVEICIFSSSSYTLSFFSVKRTLLLFSIPHVTTCLVFLFLSLFFYQLMLFPLSFFSPRPTNGFSKIQTRNIHNDSP